MKNIFFLVIIFLLLQSSAVAHSTTATSDGTVSNTAYIIGYTIGQPFVKTVPADCPRIREGVRQPIKRISVNEVNSSVCDSVTWHGAACYKTGDYTKTLESVGGSVGIVAFNDYVVTKPSTSIIIHPTLNDSLPCDNPIVSVVTMPQNGTVGSGSNEGVDDPPLWSPGTILKTLKTIHL